jgi:hypothetical protein
VEVEEAEEQLLVMVDQEEGAVTVYLQLAQAH